MHIYILKLQNDKYYVGSTENIESRLKQHYDGYGSAWTRRFAPIETIAIYNDCNKFDEDKYTKECMAKYGIDNVRGGTYCEMNIDSYREQLEKELAHSTDKCFNCGIYGHYSRDCEKSRRKKKCRRCERKGHTYKNCYAKTDVYGYSIEEYSEEDDSEYYSEYYSEYDSEYYSEDEY